MQGHLRHSEEAKLTRQQETCLLLTVIETIISIHAQLGKQPLDVSKKGFNMGT